VKQTFALLELEGEYQRVIGVFTEVLLVQQTEKGNPDIIGNFLRAEKLEKMVQGIKQSIDLMAIDNIRFVYDKWQTKKQKRESNPDEVYEQQKDDKQQQEEEMVYYGKIQYYF